MTLDFLHLLHLFSLQILSYTRRWKLYQTPVNEVFFFFNSQDSKTFQRLAFKVLASGSVNNYMLVVLISIPVFYSKITTN